MQRTNHFEADARVRHDGQDFVLTLAEQNALVSSGSYWHGVGDPSTWLAVDVFKAVLRKYADLPETVAIDLCAVALGISRAKLIDRIRWHENYMRWHDGVEYSVLDERITS